MAIARLNVQVNGLGVVTYDKRELKKLLRRGGAEVAAAARKLIRQASGGGRFYRGPGGSAARYRGGYKPGGHQASAAGQAPVSVTGTLERSIKVRPFRSGEGVAVRETAFYALFLQAGAKGGVGSGRKGVKGTRNKRSAAAASRSGKVRILQPRPSLTAALEQRQKSLGDRIRAQIVDDVTFRRMKA